MKIDLGKIAITLEGNWKSGISYEALTFVLYATADGGDGCGYIAKKDNISIKPGADNSTWMKVTEPGQSLYDLAVAHGFDGTETEFVQKYNDAVQSAIDAATVAAASATSADEAEEARAEAERSRTFAEAGRVTAEQARALAESARVTAESARVAADTNRGLATDEAVSACATAKRLCDEATTRCNQTISNTVATVEQAQSDVADAVSEANAARDAANTAAQTTANLNGGLIGISYDDGDLILVQNAETGTVSGAEIDDDGTVTIEFEV